MIGMHHRDNTPHHSETTQQTTHIQHYTPQYTEPNTTLHTDNLSHYTYITLHTTLYRNNTTHCTTQTTYHNTDNTTHHTTQNTLYWHSVRRQGRGGPRIRTQQVSGFSSEPPINQHRCYYSGCYLIRSSKLGQKTVALPGWPVTC